MSIERRLTSLQEKVDELLEVVKHNGRCPSPNPLEEPIEFEGLKSAQAEIRTLELWKCVVAECLGTLCFVFFVCGVSIPWSGHFPPFLSVAFTSALAYGAITYTIFRGSHLNPAFTIALAAIKIISPLRCLLFVTAQCGGAIAGAALLFSLTVAGYQGNLGVTTIASHVSGGQALGLELILCFVMALTFISDPKNSLPTTAVFLAANLVAIPCTGAGLNPARSLGPAFVMNKWPSHWIFWIGPILGSVFAAYFHRFVIKRPQRMKKVRQNPTDGDSLDLPANDLPNTAPDRLLCERIEPLYGGTRSLYLKPSPVLPRTNLTRSKSVYSSKRLEYQSRLDLLRKYAPSQTDGQATTNHFSTTDSNYDEPIYDRKDTAGGGTPSSLLLPGPPSFDSNFQRTYESSIRSHSSNRPRERAYDLTQQQNNENQTNKLLAQYETSKGVVDIDLKTTIKSLTRPGSHSHHNYQSHCCEHSEHHRKGNGNETNNHDKKLIDTNDSSSTNGSQNSRFRPPHGNNGSGQYSRYIVAPTTTSTCSNDGVKEMPQNRSASRSKRGSSFSNSNEARKPYEYLEESSLTKTLLDFSSNTNHVGNPSANHSSHHHAHHNHDSSRQAHGHESYAAKLLMAEADATYSRGTEGVISPQLRCPPSPMLNDNCTNSNMNSCESKIGGGSTNSGNLCPVTPKDHFVYSYH